MVVEAVVVEAVVKAVVKAVEVVVAEAAVEEVLVAQAAECGEQCWAKASLECWARLRWCVTSLRPFRPIQTSVWSTLLSITAPRR